MDFKRARLKPGKAQEYLEKFVSYERLPKIEYDDEHFNLERIRRTLRDLNVDYSKLKFVHVAGSKGKGTVCGIVADYLFKSGFKVGLFTSPHMFDVSERIKLDGENINKAKFDYYVESLKEFFDTHGDYGLTYFEILTILALQFFVDEKVDFAVFEVGLGGRLDATNIINPLITILTTVEKEHSDVLGDTVEKILREKLGIVKDKVPLIVGFQNDHVYALIKESLAKKEDVIFVQDLIFDDVFDDLEFFDQAKIKNAKIAFEVLKCLLGDVDLDLFRRVVLEFKLVGRFDCRNIDGKEVVFDMAHTPGSIENLISALRIKFPESNFVFLVSVMKGKEVGEILKLISAVANLIVFTSSNKEREIPANELANLFGNDFSETRIEEDADLAFAELVKNAKQNEVIVVTGSHFLVSRILEKGF